MTIVITISALVWALYLRDRAAKANARTRRAELKLKALGSSIK